MSNEEPRNRLDRPVDPAYDHCLGSERAEIMLVEYGSYACPHCRHAYERIAEVRTRPGDRLGYVFRHRPVSGSDLARRAAGLAETAPDGASFWAAHVQLMTRSETLIEDDLAAVAKLLRARTAGQDHAEAARRARARVDADVASAQASGVRFTPTFFVNGRRYDGPWDENSFADAPLGTLGHRVRARWPGSASRCRCSSPDRPSPRERTSPQRRSPCSRPRSCRLSSASASSGSPIRSATEAKDALRPDRP
jgi:NhaA family Na+:H+ antiporter